MVRKVAEMVPAGVRQAIYTILGTLIALEQVWDVMPDVLEGKVLATLAALGFVLAAANTPARITQAFGRVWR